MRGGWGDRTDEETPLLAGVISKWQRIPDCPIAAGRLLSCPRDRGVKQSWSWSVYSLEGVTHEARRLDHRHFELHSGAGYRMFLRTDAISLPCARCC